MRTRDKALKGRPASPRPDKRSALRHEILRQGEILFGGQRVYCAVCDVSATGARLQVGVEVPKTFTLTLVGYDGYLSAECKWRDGDYMGVCFQEPLSPEDVKAVRPRYTLTPSQPEARPTRPRGRIR